MLPTRAQQGDVQSIFPSSSSYPSTVLQQLATLFDDTQVTFVAVVNMTDHTVMLRLSAREYHEQQGASSPSDNRHAMAPPTNATIAAYVRAAAAAAVPFEEDGTSSPMMPSGGAGSVRDDDDGGSEWQTVQFTSPLWDVIAFRPPLSPVPATGSYGIGVGSNSTDEIQHLADGSTRSSLKNTRWMLLTFRTRAVVGTSGLEKSHE